MAMQSTGGAAKHGVIQSSIALLQERFRQLQREKEMRERRQLLRNTVHSSSPPSSSTSDSDSETYGEVLPSSSAVDHFSLFFSDERAPLPASDRHLVSLSLWPGSENDDVCGGGKANATRLKGFEGGKEENGFKLRWSYVECDESHPSDVDTSLHL